MLLFVEPQNIELGATMLKQVYNFIVSRGAAGAYKRELSHAFNVSRLESRMMVRNLERIGVVKRIFKDRGKQKYQR